MKVEKLKRVGLIYRNCASDEVLIRGKRVQPLNIEKGQDIQRHCEMRCSKLSNPAIPKLLKPKAIRATDEDL
jgi:hypothetical protein